MADFTLLFASDNVSIVGDMKFGSKSSKVNLFGNNLSYTGNMDFAQDSDLDFGSGAEITGTIDCNGGNVHVVTMPNFISGGFVNCTVLFL